MRFRFSFDCGCSRVAGPLYEKFAYQYAGLGAKQRCGVHGSGEQGRVVDRLDGPHGYYSMGWWTLSDGTKVFLTWSPATCLVRVSDYTGAVLPAEWQGDSLARITEESVICDVVGGGHLGGERTEPAEEILARLRMAAGD